MRKYKSLLLKLTIYYDDAKVRKIYEIGKYFLKINH